MPGKACFGNATSEFRVARPGWLAHVEKEDPLQTYIFFEVGVDDEVMGMCIKGVDTGHNEDVMEVDDSMSTIGGGAADDDAGRCDGRGREGWEVITMYKLSCHRADDKKAPHMS
jgi:hypothetical protein